MGPRCARLRIGVVDGVLGRTHAPAGEEGEAAAIGDWRSTEGDGRWASRAHWAGRDTSMVRNTGAHGKGAPNGGSGHRRGHLLPRSSAANQCREGSEPLSSSKHAAVAISAEARRLATMQTSSEYLLAWSGQSGHSAATLCGTTAARASTVCRPFLCIGSPVPERASGAPQWSPLHEIVVETAATMAGAVGGSLMEVVSHPPAAQHLHLGFRQLQELLSAPGSLLSNQALAKLD